MNNWLNTEIHLSLSRQKESLSNLHIRPQCHCVLTQCYRASLFGMIRAADMLDMILWRLAVWSLLAKLSSFSQRSGSFHTAVECRESCQLFWGLSGTCCGVILCSFPYSVSLSLAGWEIRSNRKFFSLLYLYWWFQLNRSHAKRDVEFPLSSYIMHIYFTLFVC